MATSAIRELQSLLMPAAVGTVAIVYSNIANMMTMGKIRYADKQATVHPYKPWADKGDKAEPHFRAFKACQNGYEWTIYAVPLLCFSALYAPAICSVPVVGKLFDQYRLRWLNAVFGVAFGYFNTTYVSGYIRSADDRMPGFTGRTCPGGQGLQPLPSMAAK